MCVKWNMLTICCGCATQTTLLKGFRKVKKIFPFSRFFPLKAPGAIDPAFYRKFLQGCIELPFIELPNFDKLHKGLDPKSVHALVAGG